MRPSTKSILCAALLATLAGCASVQVSGPAADAPAGTAPVANPHWNFDPARAPGDRDGYRPPRKLAVLLPMTGSLATAATPVRDGLLAAYYGEQIGRAHV